MSLFTKKESVGLDPDQKALFEYAQHRVRQKKRLYRHFVFFLAGSILFIVLNLGLGFGKEFAPFGQDWFVYAILIWLFFFLVHTFNTFVLGTFMNKKWEDEQIEKLVAKQKERIQVLQAQVDTTYPLPEKKSPSLTTAQKPDPNTRL